MVIIFENNTFPPYKYHSLPLHEVQNHPLPDDLFFLRGDVILPLGLDDTLAEVLEAGALGRRAANVDDPVQLALTLGCLRQLQQKPSSIDEQWK